MYVLDTIAREQIERFVGDINGESEFYAPRKRSLRGADIV